MKKWFLIPAILVTLLIPLLLVLTSIRLLVNPIFLDYEYGVKNFPPDEYGFSTEDRLNWGKISLAYLVNSEDISFLENLRFDDGESIYNDRELSHMNDVKDLVQLMIRVWLGGIVLFVILTILFWRTRHLRTHFKAISTGGWLTLGLIGLIIAGVLIDFDELFTQFHHLFFTGDTWLFYSTDTLIRLYPIKLWSDAFIFMGVITILGSLIAIIGGSQLARKLIK
jgi:integral membrane protein (TIGR01906 family)